MRKLAYFILSIFLCLPCLKAQDFTGFVGLTLRGSIPYGNIKDKVGEQAGLGLGAYGEIWEYGSNYASRITLGADRFPEGKSSVPLGGKGRVDVNHLSYEAVFLLRDYNRDLERPRGPYLVAGLGAYGWSIRTIDTRNVVLVRRVTKAGGSFGFGYRFKSHLEIEGKFFYSKADTSFAGAAFTLGVTLRL